MVSRDLLVGNSWFFQSAIGTDAGLPGSTSQLWMALVRRQAVAPALPGRASSKMRDWPPSAEVL
jgi:hypothetical protein